MHRMHLYWQQVLGQLFAAFWASTAQCERCAQPGASERGSSTLPAPKLNSLPRCCGTHIFCSSSPPWHAGLCRTPSLYGQAVPKTAVLWGGGSPRPLSGPFKCPLSHSVPLGILSQSHSAVAVHVMVTGVMHPGAPQATPRRKVTASSEQRALCMTPAPS